MLKWVKQDQLFLKFHWEDKAFKNFSNFVIFFFSHKYNQIFLPGPPKINFSLKFPQWSSTLQNVHKFFSLAPNLFNHWYMTILPTYPPTLQINLTSTIPLHPHATKLLRLTSSLRGTSLLWFSSVPSNHCLQSNLTLKPECHTLLLKILLRLPHTGSNPSPCSLTLHNSTILNP